MAGIQYKISSLDYKGTRLAFWRRILVLYEDVWTKITYVTDERSVDIWALQLLKGTNDIRRSHLFGSKMRVTMSHD